MRDTPADKPQSAADSKPADEPSSPFQIPLWAWFVITAVLAASTAITRALGSHSFSDVLSVAFAILIFVTPQRFGLWVWLLGGVAWILVQQRTNATDASVGDLVFVGIYAASFLSHVHLPRPRTYRYDEFDVE